MIFSSEDFKAVFSETFLKRFKKLPGNIKQHVRRSVKDILKNPKSCTLLVGDLSGLWRKKVGKYRIIYEVDWDNRVVFFHDVGPRKTIYRRVKRK